MLRIAIHANCQGRILGLALTQILRNQHRRFAVELIRSDNPDVSSLVHGSLRLQGFLQECDIFLEQLQETSGDLDAFVNPHAVRIRFPNLLMNWLWPFATQEHPRLRTPPPDHLRICFPQEVCDSSIHPFLPAPRIGFGERYRRARGDGSREPSDTFRETPRLSRTKALVQALLPERAEARDNRYNDAIDAYFRRVPPAALLDRLFELCRQKSMHDDSCADFSVWPDVERTFRDRQIFWDATHPSWEFLRPFCEKIVRSLPIALSDIAIESGLARLDANQPKEAVQAPIHPAVAKHFGLTWCDEATRFCLNPVEGMVTHREFVARYFRFDIDEEAYRAYWQTTRAFSPPEFVAAEALLASASMRHPDNAHLRFELGTNLMHQGERRARDALRHLEVASADPNLAKDTRTHASIGHLYGRLGNRYAAIDAYRKALRIRETAAIRMRVAQHLAALGHLEEAIDDMRLAIETDPFHPRWYKTLGRLLLRAKRHDEAQRCFDRAAESDCPPHGANEDFDIGGEGPQTANPRLPA